MTVRDTSFPYMANRRARRLLKTLVSTDGKWDAKARCALLDLGPRGAEVAVSVFHRFKTPECAEMLGILRSDETISLLIAMLAQPHDSGLLINQPRYYDKGKPGPVEPYLTALGEGVVEAAGLSGDERARPGLEGILSFVKPMLYSPRRRRELETIAYAIERLNDSRIRDSRIAEWRKTVSRERERFRRKVRRMTLAPLHLILTPVQKLWDGVSWQAYGRRAADKAWRELEARQRACSHSLRYTGPFSGVRMDPGPGPYPPGRMTCEKCGYSFRHYGGI